MAGKGFDRTVFQQLEKAIVQDQNQAAAQAERTLRWVLEQMAQVSATSINHWRGGGGLSFLGAGLMVYPGAGMNVGISPGFGFQQGLAETNIGSVPGVDDLSLLKPAVLSAIQTIAIDAAPGSGTRVDVIEVMARRGLENLTSREVLNPTLATYAAQNINKTLSQDLLGLTGRVVDPAPSTQPIGYRVGAGAGAIATPGYTVVAEIHVPTGTASITAANILDRRSLVKSFGNGRVTARLSCNWAAGVFLPTLSGYTAPPGFKVIARGSATQGVFALYAIAGDEQGAGALKLPAVFAQTEAPGPLAADQFWLYPVAAGGTLSAGDVTDLADVAKSHPNYGFVVGQPYVKATVTTRANGAWVNPMTFNVSIDMR